MKRYRYLDERKFHYFCQWLTLDSKDMEVLDKVLSDIDRKTKMPSRILAHNQSNGFGPPPRFTGPQIIANVEKYSSPEKGPLSLLAVVTNSAGLGAAPAVHVYLRSPTLDIPQEKIGDRPRFFYSDTYGRGQIYLSLLGKRRL
jgi:hypothetical protein